MSYKYKYHLLNDEKEAQQMEEPSSNCFYEHRWKFLLIIIILTLTLLYPINITFNNSYLDLGSHLEASNNSSQTDATSTTLSETTTTESSAKKNDIESNDDLTFATYLSLEPARIVSTSVLSSDPMTPATTTWTAGTTTLTFDESSFTTPPIQKQETTRAVITTSSAPNVPSLQKYVDSKTPIASHSTSHAAHRTMASELSTNQNHASNVTLWKDYYVHTKHCRMPRVNPFTPESKKLFNHKRTVKCFGGQPLITKNFDKELQRYKLHKNYDNETIRCCYSQVIRSGSGGSADKKFKLLPCSEIHQDFVVPKHVDGMIINCNLNNTSKVFSQEAYTFIQPQASKRSSSPSKNTTARSKRKPNLLLIGIDSMSRMNFRRTMPETFKFLQTHESWFEMEGYNKVGDNTFPNLMPLLTGKNYSFAFKACNPTKVGVLDKCNFIWKDFRRNDYVTAYAEDVALYSTFNYLKKGFLEPPVDHYFRPFGLAIEKHIQQKKLQCSFAYCLGRRTYGEHIYDFGYEFAERYRKQPAFGLFWTNSFSHNCFYLPSAMDSRMRQYFESFESSGIMDEAIIVFFSDHGRRWGPLLSLAEGFLEERLPMFFISLPKWFRSEHPELVKALSTNRHRLTTPFDAYSTWQHILKLNGVAERDLPRADGCKTGQSLFSEIPENRTCEEACIPTHWCTCQSYFIVKKNKQAQTVTKLIIDEINNFLLKNMNFTNKCSKLSLKKINSVMLKHSEDKMEMKNTPTYRVKFSTQPSKAEFEATVIYETQHNRVSVDIPDISRLNKYESDSKCIEHKISKKFCVCLKK